MSYNKKDIRDYSFRYLDKKVELVIDREMGSKHPRHHHIYPLNYGYIPNTIAPDGEAIDGYLLGVFEPVTRFKGRVIAIIHRRDDEDDKLIVVPDGVNYSNDQIKALTEFQERFFTSVIIR